MRKIILLTSFLAATNSVSAIDISGFDVTPIIKIDNYLKYENDSLNTLFLGRLGATIIKKNNNSSYYGLNVGVDTTGGNDRGVPNNLFFGNKNYRVELGSDKTVLGKMRITSMNVFTSNAYWIPPNFSYVKRTYLDQFLRGDDLYYPMKISCIFSDETWQFGFSYIPEHTTTTTFRYKNKFSIAGTKSFFDNSLKLFAGVEEVSTRSNTQYKIYTGGSAKISNLDIAGSFNSLQPDKQLFTEYLFDIGVKYNFTNTAIAIQYIMHAKNTKLLDSTSLRDTKLSHAFAVGANHKLLDNVVWYGEFSILPQYDMFTGLKFEL